MEKQPVAKVHIFPLLNRGEPQPQEPYFKPTGYSWTKIMNDNASFSALILKERENRKLYSHYQPSGPSISSFKNCFPKGSGTGWVVRKLQSLEIFFRQPGKHWHRSLHISGCEKSHLWWFIFPHKEPCRWYKSAVRLYDNFQTKSYKTILLKQSGNRRVGNPAEAAFLRMADHSLDSPTWVLSSQLSLCVSHGKIGIFYTTTHSFCPLKIDHASEVCTLGQFITNATSTSPPLKFGCFRKLLKETQRLLVCWQPRVNEV